MSVRAAHRWGGALGSNDWPTKAATGLGTAVVTAVGVLHLGVPGAVVGAVLVVAWLVASPVYVVALAHVGFAPLLPLDPALRQVVLFEAPLVVVLVADLVDGVSPLRSLAVGLASVAAVGTLLFVGFTRSDALWHVATLLVAVTACLAFALYRYAVATLEVADGF